MALKHYVACAAALVAVLGALNCAGGPNTAPARGEEPSSAATKAKQAESVALDQAGTRSVLSAERSDGATLYDEITKKFGMSTRGAPTIETIHVPPPPLEPAEAFAPPPASGATQVVVAEACPSFDLGEDRLVLFARDQASLSPAACDVLRTAWARAINEGPLAGHYVQVEGHTCSLGTNAHNLALSWERARNVCRYLADECGVAPERLYAVGYGEMHAPHSNATEASRAKNRRVRFVDVGKMRLPTTASRGAAKAYDEQVRGVQSHGLLREPYLKGGLSSAPMRRLDAPVRLPSGAIFQVCLDLYEGCHVFVVFSDSEGGARFLVPDVQTEPEDNLPYGQWIDWTTSRKAGSDRKPFVLPGQSYAYKLDANPGRERVYVLASRRPVSKPNELLDAVKRARKPEEALMNHVSEVHVIDIEHTP